MECSILQKGLKHYLLNEVAALQNTLILFFFVKKSLSQMWLSCSEVRGEASLLFFRTVDCFPPSRSEVNWDRIRPRDALARDGHADAV